MLVVEQRRKARIAALQFLFGLEFRPFEGDEELKDFWRFNPYRKSVRPYAEKLIRGVIEKKEEIDEIIKQGLLKWNWNRVGYIEKVILRIAIFEGGLSGLVPSKTSISEAIELAKMFGSEDAPKFINGILDRVFKQQKWINTDDEEDMSSEGVK